MKNLINHILENYKTEGTVMVNRKLAKYSHIDDVKTEFSVSVFVTDEQIIYREAPTMKELRRMILAELNERGLGK